MAVTEIETKIANALMARLTALVFSPALPVAAANVSFTPPATTYLRVDQMRNATDRVVIANSGPHRQQGIMQVSVMAPLNQGDNIALEIAGRIADWFVASPRLFFDGGSVRIAKRPDIASFKSSDGTRWQAPVSVAWEVYA